MDVLIYIITVGMAFVYTAVGLENLAQKAAFKGSASASDISFDNNWGSADRAVDGHLQTERGEATCSFTTALYYKTAWWKYTLSQLSNVAYLEIFFRLSTVNRHVGFSVYVFNDSSYIPPSTGGYKVFRQDSSSCPEQVMNVTVNKLTRGIALFNSKDPPLKTSCSGYEPKYATIEVCEVKVMGCKSQHYGDPCKLCSTNCLNRQCDAFDGSCIYGCSDRFVDPPECSTCKDGYYGGNCFHTCGKCKIGTVCNGISGICPEGCQNGWSKPSCQVCDDRFYGEKCTSKCGHCKPGTYCHNLTGVCVEGCDVHWIGSYCDVCDDGFYGASCSEVCGFCNESTCNKTNGYCITGCQGEWIGPKCDELALQNRSSLGSIVGGILVVVILSAGFVICIVVLKRRRNLKNEAIDKRSLTVISERDCQENKEEKTLGYLAQPSPEYPLTSLDYAADSVYYNANQTSRDVRIEELQSYIAAKDTGEKSLFFLEYKRLPTEDLESCSTAQKKENFTKNRFKTTFPYEHSRVILKEKWNKDDDDYINANYIRDLYGENSFIATQAPQKNTIVDFWRMIWQENIECVIMLTNLVENGKNKCKEYWPNKDRSLKIGPCKVLLLEETVYACFTVRKMSLQRENSSTSRIINQYHYTAWPDHGTPEEIGLVQFHRAVTMRYEPGAPLLVHCSAGVGRTGTYIGVNVLLQQGRETGRINVFEFVKQMREDRMNMVQTVEQYVFLHKALLCGFQDQETVISERDIQAKVFNLLNDASPFNQQKLNNEFQLLKALKPVFDIETKEDALKHSNRTKNVDMDILPASKYRPFLTTYVRGRNDYINAVFISTFTNPLGFILTQSPLPDTEVDLWRLCKDHDVESVVILVNDNVGANWLPNGGEKLQCKPFTISTENKGFDSDGIQQDRLLLSTDDYKSYVEVFRIPSENDADLLKVAKLLLDKENASTSLVISSNGAGSAGVFCVLHNALEQLRMDGEVDIFTRVRQIQTRRPEVITTYEEYRRCYQLLVGSVSSEGIYANV